MIVQPTELLFSPFLLLFPQLTFQSNLPWPSRLITSYRSKGQKGWVGEFDKSNHDVLYVMSVVCVCTVYLFIDSVIVAKGGGYGRWMQHFHPFPYILRALKKREKKLVVTKENSRKKTTARQLTLRYSVAIKLKHYSSPRGERV